ncbi:NADP-dependent oxidoreductase [Herbiconiux sp. CPCC 205763]|uniref:NADP-dependent oxidoreductase n=1 Tax=Herbiconiux aconitum TaxID=2970913 RepID=A0ABT2GRZ3_9MICO|nr:NADP-dependent oxidoreductase [Herbiconiux aconitum]MCS5717709.1 NADP-dependent oxidoreductase [Herbiconiux aconitum]
MKVVGLTEFGGPEVLRTFDLPTPTPEAGEVRIKVFAATVNPADFYLRDGRSAGAVARFRPPFIPGVEAAGIIDAVGPGVGDRLQVGDRVTAHVMPLTQRGGAYAEEVVTLAKWTVKAPRGASFVEAATLPMNGMTALDAVEKAGARSGAVIAVVGAAGAVGGYAVQLAKAAGARVIADAAQRDRQLVRSLGAEMILDRGPGLADRLLEAHPGGVDGIVDAAGYGGALLRGIHTGGSYVFVAGGLRDEDVRYARENSIELQSVYVTNIPDSERMLEQLRRKVEDNELTLRVQRTFPPEEAAQAHALLAAGGTRGRLVLEFRAETE